MSKIRVLSKYKSKLARPKTGPVKNSQKPYKKKSLGQHFLRKKSVVCSMIDKVASSLDGATVLEIGCGDGFLTEQILAKTNCKKLVCLEIDWRWAEIVRKKISDPRLEIINVNALDVDWSTYSDDGKPMVMLANLPYNVTFPIMHKLRKHSENFVEGVVMVQEEVAQRFVAKSGRSMGSASVILQHYFDMQLMCKIGPEAFCPPPKVDSRLVYFKPKQNRPEIDREQAFWKFIKACFACPRRMLRNNLKCYNFDSQIVEQKMKGLRAQQMKFDQFLDLWTCLAGSDGGS